MTELEDKLNQIVHTLESFERTSGGDTSAIDAINAEFAAWQEEYIHIGDSD